MNYLAIVSAAKSNEEDNILLFIKEIYTVRVLKRYFDSIDICAQVNNLSRCLFYES